MMKNRLFVSLMVGASLVACDEDEVITLQNVVAEGCEDTNVLSPFLPDEAGHLTAARLEPAAYPFEAMTVRYDLIGSADAPECDASLAHRVEIYVSSDDAPSSSPSDDDTLVATIDVPAGDDAEADRVVELDLSPTVTLAEGESIFVAVEMAGNSDDTTSICVLVCGDNDGTSAVNTWSNATDEPYTWLDLVDDFGFNADLTFRVDGTEG